MKYFFALLIQVASFYPLTSMAQSDLSEAMDTAEQYLAEKLNVDWIAISNNYNVEWEYIVTYEDDQPILFKFTGTSQYCEVELGSVSLKILNYSCKAVRGIAFNQSPGCGTYDGPFITVVAPQDAKTCRQIALQKGLEDATVQSYCTSNRAVDITQTSFVDACIQAFQQ